MKDNEQKELEIVDRLPVGLIQVIQAAELIKVKTISVKIVQQMPWISSNTDYSGLELIGRVLTEGVSVVRHKSTGHLARLADAVYLDAYAKKMQQEVNMAWPEARDRANALLASLPQLFVL